MRFVYGLSIEYLTGLTLWILLGVWLGRYLLLARQRRRRESRSLRWVNAALSAWLLLVLLTLAEVYLAVFYDQTDAFNTTKTSATWYHRYVDPQINAAGFRDARELEKHPPEDARVIWFLGDSFTMGHGIPRVADRFSDRVGAALERRRPGQFLVYNIAESGTYTGQLRSWLEGAWSRDYDPPDIVIYVVCLNDIQPYMDNASATPVPPAGGLWQTVVDQSYLLDFVRSRVVQSRQGQIRDWYADMRQAYEGQPGRRLLSEISRMHYLCRRNRVDLRLVIFPFLHDLGPEYDFETAHALIAAQCQTLRIPVLDLRDILEPHVPEGLTVNVFDAHPNQRAHALAAEAIEQQLLRDLLTGSAPQAIEDHESER